MNPAPTDLPGVLVLRPTVYPDSRGHSYESYRASQGREAGIPPMVQTNVSRSRQGVLRGLHLQVQQPQAKLISVLRGSIFDVAADVRVGSATYGRWHGQVLSDENHLQLFIPAGFAHGFCVLSEWADVIYQCSDYYHPQSELTIRWDDPDLAIDWPVTDPILSDKDLRGQWLRALE